MGIDFLSGLIKGFLTFGLKNKGSFFVRGKRVKILCKSKLSIQSNVRVCDQVHIDALSLMGINIGANSTIGSKTIIKCTGNIKDLGVGVNIGKNFGCGENCFLGAAGGIEIGNDVIMGQSVRFHAQNHNYEDSAILIREQGVNQKGIKIGNDC